MSFPPTSQRPSPVRPEPHRSVRPSARTPRARIRQVACPPGPLAPRAPRRGADPGGCLMSAACPH
ncbi:MAG: hypothetical protein AMJ46_14235 [Latescibacteria bacterium DG_63]|nr:MAG: hypothetical protein AMJ46_14235 [Latescibacteria bacterium DG_63]